MIKQWLAAVTQRTARAQTSCWLTSRHASLIVVRVRLRGE
ncbi:MAG: hypothetical protein RLY87_1924 [Chloroflexota bacterium]|jgi:hypothetical protein